VDLPIKNGDFPWLWDSFPGSNDRDHRIIRFAKGISPFALKNPTIVGTTQKDRQKRYEIISIGF